MKSKKLLTFYPSAWSQYVAWEHQGHRYLKKINRLIKSILRNGYQSGLGKPEHLKHYPKNIWSRRITQKDRLVYVVRKNLIVIASCKYHY